MKIFLSYSTKNSSFADRLANDLKNLNANIFYDKWSIKVGDSIVDKISEALSSHDILLVLLSTESVKSDWVKKEINTSLMGQLSSREIKILPVLIEKCEVPTLLKEIKYADFSANYRSGFEEIVLSLEDNFELAKFEELVKAACNEISVEEEIKEIAKHLKKNIHMSFSRCSVFSCICERGSISKEELLFQFDSREEILDQINPLVEEELLTLSFDNESVYY